MPIDVIIRSERSEDAPTICDVVRRAYADVAYSDHREHLMVERLRSTDAFIPALSLVAEVAGAAVGHLLLTRAEIRTEQAATPSLALAPLSIAPDHQNRRVGARLVEQAHAKAADLGFGSILVVGPREYYRRFGYQALSRYPIRLPFHAPDESCMIIPLSPGALEGVRGEVAYAPGWLDH